MIKLLLQNTHTHTKDTGEVVYKASSPKSSPCFKESTPHAPFSWSATPTSSQLSSLSLVSLSRLSFVSYLSSLCHGKCIIDLHLNPAVNPFTVLNGKKSCIDSSGNPRRCLWRRRNQQAGKNYLEPLSSLSLALWCGVEKQNFSPVDNSLDDSSSDQHSFQGARGGALLCSHSLVFPCKRLVTFFFSFEVFFGNPLGCCCCLWRAFLVKRESCAATLRPFFWELGLQFMDLEQFLHVAWKMLIHDSWTLLHGAWKMLLHISSAIASLSLKDAASWILNNGFMELERCLYRKVQKVLQFLVMRIISGLRRYWL
jgi:hypothetical protein